MGFLNLIQNSILLQRSGLGIEEKELADLVKNMKLGQEKLR